MSGNGSYFLQSPPPQQLQIQSSTYTQHAPSPSYPPPPSYAPSSSQQSWAPSPISSPALNASPIPVYNPSAFAGKDQQQQNAHFTEQQQQFPPGIQSSPPNAPPTPVYTPTAHGHPVSTYSATHYFPPPPQPNNQQPPATGSSPHTKYYPGAVNAPPTPAYTPSPYGHPHSNPQDTNGPATQYFPPPPPCQPSHIQHSAAESKSESLCNELPANEPPAQTYSTQHSLNAIPPSACEPEGLDTSKCPQNDNLQTQHHVQLFQSQLSPPTAIHSPHNDYPQEKQQFQQAQPPDAPQSTFSRTPQTASVQPSPTQRQPDPPPYSPKPEQSQGGFAQEKEEFQSNLPNAGRPQSLCPQEKQQFQQYPPQYSYLQQQPQYPITGQQQQFNLNLVQQPCPTYTTIPGNLPSMGAPMPSTDGQNSSRTKRFLGDTLVGRVARSSVSTVSSTVKMPAVLSPWGDNNPVTLPNVRYRDAVLFGTFSVIGAPLVDGCSDLVTNAFGADTFVSEVVSSGAGFITGNTIVKYGVFQIVEQAIDKGVLEHILPEVEKTMRTTSVKSLQVSIKHKLMGVDADIRFVGTYPTTSALACDKGWFTDTALTHKLVTESASVIPLCDPNPTARLPHARLFITFTGIDPFRAGMWSTSRRPGCGQLHFHILNGCPALVMPVSTAKAPVLAWSPWTLNQMQNSGVSGYRAGTHHEEICNWLLELVERQGLYPCVKNIVGAFERIMGKVVTMIINGALMAPKGKDGRALGKVDPERAGIVMFSASLKQGCPDGIYISLKPGNPLQWSGVLFVRKGPYAPAILRFQLTLPPDYPYLPPTITLVTDVFHPLITPLTMYTYTTGSLSSNTVSATDEERLPPGSFILRHGFPHWFGRAQNSLGSSATSFRTVSGSFLTHSPVSILPIVRSATVPSGRGIFTQPSTPLHEGGNLDQLGQSNRYPTICQVLEYVKRSFDDGEFLDSVPLDAAGNVGAWKAWRAHRAGSGVEIRHGVAMEGLSHEGAEWNWDGVWEQRVQRGIDTSTSDSVLYGGNGGGNDLVRFVELDDSLIANIKARILGRAVNGIRVYKGGSYPGVIVQICLVSGKGPVQIHQKALSEPRDRLRSKTGYVVSSKLGLRSNFCHLPSVLPLMVAIKGASEPEHHTKVNEEDITPRPLQILKRDCKSTDANTTGISSSPISPNESTLVPTRRSSIRLNCRNQLDPSPEYATRSTLTSARRYDVLSVRKQRRSDPVNEDTSVDRMSFSPSLEVLLHMPSLEGGDKPLSTDTQPKPKRTACVSSDQGPPKVTLRSHSSGIIGRAGFLNPNTDDSPMLHAPSPMTRGRWRALSAGDESTQAYPGHRVNSHPLRRQPSFKRGMISRMMSGLTGKMHLNHVTTIDADQATCALPDPTNSRPELSISTARHSTSSSYTELCNGSDLRNVLAAFPSPPKYYAASPTTTKCSLETPKSRNQVYRELSKPQNITALAPELNIVPEFDQISLENPDSMFVAIDIKAALTVSTWRPDHDIPLAGLDVVAIIDNSLHTSPTSLMAGCETARFLASLLDIETDRLAIVCTSAEEQAYGPKVISPLSHIKMHKLKTVLDDVESSTIRSYGSHTPNAIEIAQGLLLDRPTTEITNVPLHDTYGHIFLFATHIDDSIRNFTVDAKLTLHVICPGTLPRNDGLWPNFNGWWLRTLTGRGPRILNRKRRDDSLDNLYDGLQTLIQQARSGQVLEPLRDICLEIETGPDCVIEEVLGQKHFAVLRPGELRSVVVKIKGKKPKVAEAWLCGPVPSMDVSGLFSELERMLLGFVATPIVTALLSYKHPLLPSDTACQMIETCEVRRVVTAPGESMLVRRPTSLLETENRVTVHQRLAYHHVTKLSLQGAVSALGKVISDGDGRMACPGYVALLMKEKKFQARLVQRLSIMDSPHKPARTANTCENRGSEASFSRIQDPYRADPEKQLDSALNLSATRNSPPVGDESQSDAARKIWGDLRLKSRPNGSHMSWRTVSSKIEEQRSTVLREAALRNKRSIGADTLRSLSSSAKGSTALAAPWM
ncbi:MAG: hypothetical protein Q9217_002974 [Psora testacea]